MGTLKWYKRDPRAALFGMMDLTLEETGAYCKILEMIYAHDGALPDKPGYICRMLNCNIRTWRRLKVRLLERGKIYLYRDHIRNERADDETFNVQSLVAKAKLATGKRWATYNEIKRLRDAVGLQPTTTYKNLSANIVPMTPDKKK